MSAKKNMVKMPASLAVKLGSIVVHADELLSPNGHHFDRAALNQLLDDAEVKEWLAAMSKTGMLPVKRIGILHRENARRDPGGDA